MITDRAKGIQFMREGWADLYKIQLADLAVGFSNQQITLRALAAGDLVLGATIDVKTTITGPTGSPTAQVKINSAGIAITPTCVVNSSTVSGSTTNNTIVGAAHLQTGTDSLVLDLQVGGGNGAAATAGEIWVWVRVSTRAERVTNNMA